MKPWIKKVWVLVSKHRDLSSFEGTKWRYSQLGQGSWCAWRENTYGDRLEIHPPADGPLPWAKFVSRKGEVHTYG